MATLASVKSAKRATAKNAIKYTKTIAKNERLKMKKITKKIIAEQIDNQWPHAFYKNKTEGVISFNVDNNKTPHPLTFEVKWEHLKQYGEDANYNDFYNLSIRCPDLDVSAPFEFLADGYFNLQQIADKITDYIYNLK